MKVGLYGIGLLGPGLPGYTTALPVLSGATVLTADMTTPPSSQLLPANERRRTTATIRLALKVAEEATVGTDRSALPSVFASSSGDIDIIDRICEALAQPEPMISPMQFHHSVHNAPAGNWSIATRNTQPSTAISGFDASFSAGLLEAAVLQQTHASEVLLVGYDVPSTTAFARSRPISIPFAVALRLGPPDAAVPRLTLALTRDRPESRCISPGLEAQRPTHPAARALPLLERLARQQAGDVILAAPLGRCLHLRLDLPTAD